MGDRAKLRCGQRSFNFILTTAHFFASSKAAALFKLSELVAGFSRGGWSIEDEEEDDSACVEIEASKTSAICECVQVGTKYVPSLVKDFSVSDLALLERARHNQVR